MGVIGRILGGPGLAALGDAATGVANAFRPDATRSLELSAEAQKAALDQLSAEYGVAGGGWFDRAVNGLNRLPRPMLAFGTLALFVYAMIDPPGFGERMTGLNMVPEPLWWLLGAIVAFYFGAREAHYFRFRPVQAPPTGGPAPETRFDDNAALEDWRAGNGADTDR
jgi:Holin of 3TMs, for gene-transfer release